VYKFIRENGGWYNWIFEVIEEFPCENRTELRIRERDHYDLLNPALNTNRPYTTEEEKKEQIAKWHQDNIEERKEQKAKNYQDNIEERKEQNAKWYQDNIEERKEQMAKYYQDNIEEIKEKKAKYYEDNIEKIAKYREDNRDEILKHNKQKHNCECGGKYTTNGKLQHLNTNKHKKFLKNQEEN
jgi:hypothetical protein